jgi:hypothetical protein
MATTGRAKRTTPRSRLLTGPGPGTHDDGSTTSGNRLTGNPRPPVPRQRAEPVVGGPAERFTTIRSASARKTKTDVAIEEAIEKLIIADAPPLSDETGRASRNSSPSRSVDLQHTIGGTRAK